MKFIKISRLIYSLILFLFIAITQVFPVEKKPVTPSILVIEENELIPGVTYRNVLIGKGKFKHSVHVVEANLNNPFVSAAVLKAQGQVNELEKLHDMIRKFDTSHKDAKVLASINANFWRAYTNRPIGPTIIDGEVLEMITHKQWTSGFFDKISFLYIDTFFIKGSFKTGTGEIFQIDRVNRRQDSLGISFYNRFGGDTIPYVQTSTLKKAFQVALQDTVYDDSTEAKLDTAGLRDAIRTEQMESNLEHLTKKISVRYVDNPAVNKLMRCIVIAINDSGHVKMPENGAVITFGDDYRDKKLPEINDTLFLKFSTNIYDSVEFYNSVSGTPRLVRNGIAKHEAREEGSRGRRFINRTLPRTAIGTNQQRTKIYLVAVEAGSNWKRTRGASLAQLANIMKAVGCYDAMNLDGGGSSMLIIDNKNLMRTNPKSSRAISVGLSIIQKIYEDSKKKVKK
ncbi:MAG: phosphodiester glycosidase family protein [bacterium]